MIKTTRSRLEIRQEPDAAASLVGAITVAFGAMEFLLSAGAALAHVLDGAPGTPVVALLRLILGAGFFAAGWVFLRARSRVVLDLDHRMVLRYIGVGGRGLGGNESHDLAEFGAVVLVSRERRSVVSGTRSRSEVVCLRRPDGSDLEIYWARDASDGASTGRRVADFAALPYLGRGSR